MSPQELKARRRKLGLTQVQLAGKLGLTRDAIAKMEAGQRPIVLITEMAIEHLTCKINSGPTS